MSPLTLAYKETLRLCSTGSEESEEEIPYIADAGMLGPVGVLSASLMVC
jgi:hypothetical protein